MSTRLPLVDARIAVAPLALITDVTVPMTFRGKVRAVGAKGAGLETLFGIRSCSQSRGGTRRLEGVWLWPQIAVSVEAVWQGMV